MDFRKFLWLFYVGAVAMVGLVIAGYMEHKFMTLGIVIFVVALAVHIILSFQHTTFGGGELQKLTKRRDRGEISQAEYELQRERYFSNRPR